MYREKFSNYFRFALVGAFIGALAIFIITSPITLVKAQLSTFQVPLLDNPVTLDGTITGNEWSDANGMNVTFVEGSLAYNGTIYLKHNCTDLWMCIQVEDDDEEFPSGSGFMADLVGVIFDANGNMTTDGGDDMAALVHKNMPMDMAFTASPPSPAEEDDTLGGVMNVYGASAWEAGIYTFELSKPLNSGDSAGNDIALLPGDEISVMFIYNDLNETVEAPPFIGFMLSLEPRPVWVFPIAWNEYTFNVTMMSNSTISDFNFSQADMEISFNVTGPEGKAGYCNVTVPKDLLRDSPWTILLNGTDWTSLCTITENDTHTFIYIPYAHSTKTIQITGTWVVPEFSSFLILSLFMVATLLAVVIYITQISRKIK